MKYLKHYNIFESVTTDTRSEIFKILSELEGNFGFKVRLQYADGPVKRISQKLGIAPRIKIEIMKFQDKEKLERWNKTGSLSQLARFNFSELEYVLMKIEDAIKDNYKTIELVTKKGNTSWQYNVGSIEKWHNGKFEVDNLSAVSVSYVIKSGYLPVVKKGEKGSEDLDSINDIFQDLTDSLEGVKLKIREIGDYTRVILENLKPDTSSTSFGGNAWIPLTDEQKSELKGAILKYEGMYEMSFFDSQVKFKQETPSSLKEKVIKSQEELFEFIDTGKPVAVTIIFKKND